MYSFIQRYIGLITYFSLLLQNFPTRYCPPGNTVFKPVINVKRFKPDAEFNITITPFSYWGKGASTSMILYTPGMGKKASSSLYLYSLKIYKSSYLNNNSTEIMKTQLH